MKTSISTFILSLSLVIILASCGNNDPKFISEGVIEYNAQVVDKSHPMAGLAPSTMSMFFKTNLYCSEMSTMGMFNSKFVANPTAKTFTTMVKILNEKNACIENEVEIKSDQLLNKLEFTETKETKEIAGYTCKKVIATKASDPTVKFDVYYTEGLNVKNPNYSTPYESLNGIVMQFRLKKFGMEMEFTAKSVSKEEVDDEMFQLPGFYNIITKQAMDEFFNFMK